MARYESAARRYDSAMPARPRREVEPRRDFEVVEGRGLDARVREGVSHDFRTRVRIVLVCMVAVLVLGALRVGLLSASVASLQHSTALRAQIEEAENLEAELKVEHSVLNSTARIERIATQNYGMVLASETATITIHDRAAEPEAEAAEAPKGEQDADAAQGAGDGEVTQTADEAGETTPEA